MSDYENRYRIAQETISNALKPVHEAQKIIYDSLEPYRIIQNAITEMMRPYQKLSKFCSSPFTSSLEKFSHSIYEEISSSIGKISFDDSASAENIRKTIQHMVGSYLNRKILDFPSEKPFQFLEDLGGLPEDDDFVIIEEPVIRELEIPDTLAIPIGHNKIRIKTEILVSLLLTIFFGLISFIQTEYHERKSSDSEQEYQKAKLLIEEERNQKLQDFLNSIDLSNSSQRTSINNLIHAIESLSSSLQDSEIIPQESDSILYPVEEIHNKNHE